MKKRQSVSLMIWGSGEHYWGGWQGFSGLYKNRAKAIDRLKGDKNKYNNKAQLVDFGSLRILADYEKKDGVWVEIRK